MVRINDAMRVKDFKVAVMENIREKDIYWPYDEIPRMLYSGRWLQTLPDDMYLTCAYQTLWTECVLQALPPANATARVNSDNEEEEGEEEEESEEEGQAE